jgi:hypothetical protein
MPETEVQQQLFTHDLIGIPDAVFRFQRNNGVGPGRLFENLGLT